jgi:hypothetical protein
MPGAAPGPAGTYSEEVTLDNPVAFYLHNELTSDTTMADSSGNGYDGAYVGSPTREAARLINSEAGTAVTFSGSQYASLPSLGSFGSSLAAGISFETWIDTAALTKQTIVTLFGSGSTSGNQEFRVTLNADYRTLAASGHINVWLQDGAGHQLIGATRFATAINDGNPHHLVVTINVLAKTIAIYLDNVAQDVRYYILPVTWSAWANFTAGYLAARETGDPELAATVDATALYNAVLSVGRVESHYQAAGYLSGTATGTADLTADVAPSLVLDGTALATFELTGFASASLTLDGTAEASAELDGAATATLTPFGECELEISGDATASLLIDAAALGVGELTGLATPTLLIDLSATCTIEAGMDVRLTHQVDATAEASIECDLTADLTVGNVYRVYRRSEERGPDRLWDHLPAGSGTADLAGFRASSVQWLHVKAVSECGVEDVEPVRLVRVEFDAAGELVGSRPNPPIGLELVQGANGLMTLRWVHVTAGQVAAAKRYRIFVDSGAGMPGTPTHLVAFDGGREYRKALGTFAHGTQITVAIEAQSAAGGVSRRVEIAGTADASAPAAPDSLAVEVIRAS